MGAKSQRKGRGGELELSRILRGQGYDVEAGRALSYGEVPDLSGLPGVHIECKRTESLRLSEWMQQARRDADRFGDGLPAVFHRRSREGGAVRKHQYSIATMSYYEIAEYSLYDCADSRITATAEKLGLDPAELYEMIETKLEPLRERIEAEFHQSAEYITHEEHQRIIADYMTAQNQFCSRYNVDKSDYDRCYDVFGVLRNKEYLAKLKAEHKARKAAEREKWRRYQEAWSGTYSDGGSRSYSIPSVSTYTEDETAILKKFYRSLSKLYHPDMNPGKDTTEEMKLLNRLKEAWGV